MKPRRRFILTIICCLLAGAMVNVLVAWGLAVAPHKNLEVTSAVSHSSLPNWQFIKFDHIGITQFESVSRTYASPFDPVIDAPSWSIASRKPRGGEINKLLNRWEYAYGLPLRSLMSEQHARLGMGGITIIAGLDVGREFEPLPTRIIVGGFVINTFIYAALVILIVFSPRLGRRRRRLKRGLCPGCAYDLRGAAHAKCPECGVAVKQMKTMRCVAPARTAGPLRMSPAAQRAAVPRGC